MSRQLRMMRTASGRCFRLAHFSRLRNVSGESRRGARLCRASAFALSRERFGVQHLHFLLCIYRSRGFLLA